MLKVKQLRIVDDVHKWMENLLNNRKQKVIINGSASDWAPATNSLPQGSVLEPEIFIIHINDIDIELNNFIVKFEDDTKIGNSVISDCDRQSTQEDLRKISAWYDRWEMPFSVNKCHILQVGSRKKTRKRKMCQRSWCYDHVEFKILSTPHKRMRVKPVECWAL